MSSIKEISSGGYKSQHQWQVEEFMRLAKQCVPDTIQSTLSPEERILRAKLILEEALETVEALGINVCMSDHQGCSWECRIGNLSFSATTDDFNIVEVIDGCCDLAVVTTGTLSACGVPDLPFQNLVNQNNLAKFGPGHTIREDGKLIKPPGHQPPDIAEMIDKVKADQLASITAETEAYVDAIIGNPILPAPLSVDIVGDNSVSQGSDTQPSKHVAENEAIERAADAYIELVNAGADRDGKVTELMGEARRLQEESVKVSDLLERARIILAEECGDNYYANCLVDEIEAALGTNEKGGAK